VGELAFETRQFSKAPLDLRWYAYGYRHGEEKLPILPPDSTIEIKEYKQNLVSKRPPMKASMGPIIMGATLPHPDTSHTATLEAGVVKRIATKMPEPDPEWLAELTTFIDQWLEENCVSLSPDVDLSFEKWLEERPYPEWRKQELREVNESIVKLSLPEKYRKVKLFMKDEDYTTYKHGRGIYARADEFKVLFGPLCAAIEEDMYSKPEFIKHVPVADRPNYIEDLLTTSADPTGTTDFRSFECSFTEKIQKAVDQRMFLFYCRNLRNSFLRRVYESLAGENTVLNKCFSFKLRAKRMSGEMNTSLNNGFANLMVNKFLIKKLSLGSLRMAVEGDDGISKTSSGRFPTTEDYAKLGFNIEIEVHKDSATASFCGIVYDRDDRINVTDPREVLANFGWASSRYARCGKKKLMALLRCKALSYLHQYPGCPIIQELALYGLRMTKSYNVKSFVENDRYLSQWERDQFREIINLDWREVIRPVGNNTRLLVERLYQISVEEQKMIEQYLHDKEELTPLLIDINYPREWIDYFNKYCFENIPSDPNWIGKPADYHLAPDIAQYVVKAQ